MLAVTCVNSSVYCHVSQYVTREKHPPHDAEQPPYIAIYNNTILFIHNVWWLLSNVGVPKWHLYLSIVIEVHRSKP